MNKILLSKLLGLILGLSIIFFGLESSYSTLLFLIIMLTIGIPHGSVDHIVAFVNPEARRFKSKFIFYLDYLSLIIINTLVWIISPFIIFGHFMLPFWRDTGYWFSQHHKQTFKFCSWSKYTAIPFFK